MIYSGKKWSLQRFGDWCWWPKRIRSFGGPAWMWLGFFLYREAYPGAEKDSYDEDARKFFDWYDREIAGKKTRGK